MENNNKIAQIEEENRLIKTYIICPLNEELYKLRQQTEYYFFRFLLNKAQKEESKTLMDTILKKEEEINKYYAIIDQNVERIKAIVVYMTASRVKDSAVKSE